jgi:alpha-1,2-mannosyltransferase
VSSELYGTEPWHWYLQNLALNFGPALPLALLAPAIAVVAAIVGRPLGGVARGEPGSTVRQVRFSSVQC